MFGNVLKFVTGAGWQVKLGAAIFLAGSAFASGWQVHSKFVTAGKVKALERQIEQTEAKLDAARDLDRRLALIGSAAAKTWRETVVPVRTRVEYITVEKEVFRDVVREIEDDSGGIDRIPIRGVCEYRADLWGLDADLCNAAPVSGRDNRPIAGATTEDG